MRLKELMPALTRYGSMIGIAADPMVHVQVRFGPLRPIQRVEKRDGCIVLILAEEEATDEPREEMLGALDQMQEGDELTISKRPSGGLSFNLDRRSNPAREMMR